MKNISKYFSTVPLLGAVMIMGLSNCTKHNQVLDLTPAIPAATSGVGDTLFVQKVSSGPVLQPIGGPAWNGTIDGVFANCKKLTVHAVVPDLGNSTFTGYVGNATDITMRAVYDASNIYYMVEFTAPQANYKNALWYYNPTTRKWAQEATVPAVQPDGSVRAPAAQDQFVMMFNIAGSCQSFSSLSCYAACHVNSSYNTTASPTGGSMYTNGPSEFLDVWRARMNQVMNENQLNDCYIDWGGGALDKNEVHNDLQVNNGPVPIADGGFSNKVSLTITGKTTKETVPLWIYPTGVYSNYGIQITDTLPGGRAVKVTAVDSNGVLTLATGATIDPRMGNSFLQIPGNGDGSSCVPGSILGPYTGSRGDVICNAFFTGTSWRICMQRALTTADTQHDIDFSSLSDQYFGVGAMFDGADNEHAIVAGLIMRFTK
ncbi:MAG: ethylbenzene dehydrogenase-related protein [Bacteroidia bacterium]